MGRVRRPTPLRDEAYTHPPTQPIPIEQIGRLHQQMLQVDLRAQRRVPPLAPASSTSSKPRRNLQQTHTNMLASCHSPTPFHCCISLGRLFSAEYLASRRDTGLSLSGTGQCTNRKNKQKHAHYALLLLLLLRTTRLIQDPQG